MIIVKIYIIQVIIILIAFVIYHILKYKNIDETTGICVDVKVELLKQRESPFNYRLRGMDNRMYRYYIKYTYEGVEYIAKSYRSYQVPKVMVNDRVRVFINKDDKYIVDIINKPIRE